jgi:uncharacterized protein (DUF2147 family)
MKNLAVAFLLLACFGFNSAEETHTVNKAFGPSPFIGRWNTTRISSTDGRTSLASTLTVKADGGTTYGLDGLVDIKGASDWIMYGNGSTDGNTWTGYWSNADGRSKGTYTLTMTTTTSFKGSYTQSGYTGSLNWWGTKL